MANPTQPPRQPDGSTPDPTPLDLSPKHLTDLRRSGLSDEQIRRCGFRTETDPDAVAKLLGWRSAKGAAVLGPCLCIPFPSADGKSVEYTRLKPDCPRQKGGKAVKYESPAGRPNRAYLPPDTLPVLPDPAVPLLITEGEKKSAKADQDGFWCIGLVGVFGWQRKRPAGRNGKKAGRRELIPDLAAVAWADRRVYLVFDSDLADKPQARAAERRLAEALRAAGADVSVVRLPHGEGGAKVGLDDFLHTRGPDALRELLAPANPSTSASGDAATRPAGQKKEPPPAEQLAALGLALDLWHDPTQAAYATAGRRSHPVRSKTFHRFLVNEYRKATGGKVPGGEAMTAALAAIEATAVHDGPEYTAHARVAGHDGNVYLHLADRDDTVVEIDARGWRVCERPPVRFRRPTGMLALPRPAAGGSLAGLRSFLNVRDDDTFALVAAWLTGCFRPDGPFPLLVLLGEQGSAKTTTARVMKQLIDPTAGAVRCETRDARDLMIQAANAWVLAFDNLSGLSAWLSDAFCRLATGGGLSTRGLFTDAEEVIFDAKRPLILNGIEDFVEKPDLLERSLLIRHPPIPEDRRRSEAEFWVAFGAAHPKLLGALLDRVSAGLRELPGVALDRLPRMADFALFAVACERGAKEPERFRAAYAENQAGARQQALDATPLPAAVVALMGDRETWEGTPTDLLAELRKRVPNPPRDWPQQPNVLTNKLRRLTSDMRRVYGLDVDCDGRTCGGRSAGKRSRVVRITRLPDDPREPPSPPSPPDASDAKPAAAKPLPVGDGATGAGQRPSPKTVPPTRTANSPVPPRDVPVGNEPGDGGDGGDGGKSGRQCKFAGRRRGLRGD